MRLGFKILVPMLLVTVVLAGLWIALFVILQQQQQSLVEARHQLVATVRLTNQISELQKSTRANLLSYYFDGKQSRLDAVESAEREIAIYLATDHSMTEDRGVKRLIHEFNEIEKKSARSREEFVRGVQTNNLPATHIAFEKLSIQSDRAEASLKDLAAHSLNKLDTVLSDTVHGQLSLLRLGLYGVGAAILIILITFFYLHRNVGGRLAGLVDGLENADPANGDLHVAQHIAGSADEIGALARAFNAMTDRLHASYCKMKSEIAERQRAEERLAGVIISAMDGIITVNARREIVLVNPAAERMFGYRADDLQGKALDILIPERFHAVHAGHVENFGRTGVTNRAMGRLGRIVACRADGSEFPIEASISQMGGSEERLYTVILRDITLRVAVEAEAKALTTALQRRVEERDHAIQELEAFSYSVSHDLRAPLRAIDGFSRLALEEHGDQSDPELQRYLRMCSENAKRMGQLIDDLLGLSKVGRQVLKSRVVDAVKQVHECLAQLESEREGRQIEITVGDLPSYEADPGLVQQVWMNLIGNALKYTTKVATAQIEIGSLLAQNDTVVYYVRDNGAGFDMRYADKLFQMFQRLHRAAEFPGTGVGLATVARIVRRHGGRVWAEGTPGAGATFYFTLREGEIYVPLQAS